MTRNDMHRYARDIEHAVTLAMPRAVEDALTEEQLDDLIGAIQNAFITELDLAINWDPMAQKWKDGRAG